MSGDYEQLQSGKKFFQRVGITLVTVGLVATAAAFVAGVGEAVQYPVFVSVMLGLYAIALADFQSRMARMQAALDMKRMTLQVWSQGANVSPCRLDPGGSLRLISPKGGGWTITADRAVTLSVQEER